MDIRAVEALTGGIRTFVEAFLEDHPVPDAPPQLPSDLLENATFDQKDIDRTHYADGARYVDFPNMRLQETEDFERTINVWAKRREFPGTSREGIEKRLKRLLVDSLNEPSRIATLVASRIAAMEQRPVVEILLPITGIDLSVPEWTLAPDVRIVKMTPERFEADIVEGYVRGASERMPIYGEALAFGHGMAAILRDAFVDATVLAVRAAGDEYVAQAKAENRASVVVDVLQFAAAIFHNQHWRTFIDWTGDVPASGWRMSAQMPISGDVRPNNPGSRRGVLAPWTIDETQIGKIAEFHVDAVIAASLEQEPAEHHDMLCRAVRAFADGERQWSPDGKKLSYTTVFDIFFSTPDTDITRAIREGVAFTMFYRESADQRFEQAQFVNLVYNSRSRTSHEFETGRFGTDELQRLRSIALGLIRVMSRRSSFTKKGLAEEIATERVAMGDAYARFAKLGRDSAPDAAA